jgi:hypothetical protein
MQARLFVLVTVSDQPSKQMDDKIRRTAMARMLVLRDVFEWVVLPLTVVDNSTFSPNRLTVHSNTHYDREALSFSHFKRRGLYDLSCLPVLARGLPHPLTGGALAPLLAISSAFPRDQQETDTPRCTVFSVPAPHLIVPSVASLRQA